MEQKLCLNNCVEINANFIKQLAWFYQNYGDVDDDPPWGKTTWYFGSVDLKQLETVWMVKGAWIDRLLPNLDPREQCLKLVFEAYDRLECEHRVIVDNIRCQLVKFRENKDKYHHSQRLTMPGLWVVLLEEYRGGRQWFMLKDGNHRAIAAKYENLTAIPAFVGVNNRSLVNYC